MQSAQGGVDRTCYMQCYWRLPATRSRTTRASAGADSGVVHSLESPFRKLATDQQMLTELADHTLPVSYAVVSDCPNLSAMCAPPIKWVMRDSTFNHYFSFVLFCPAACNNHDIMMHGVCALSTLSGVDPGIRREGVS